MTHTPGSLRTIQSGVMHRLVKLTSQKPYLSDEGVDKVYPHHVNALCEAGLEPPNFPTMGDLWKIQDEKMDNNKEKEPDINRNKNINLYFCVAYSGNFLTYIHRVINRRKNQYFLSESANVLPCI